MKIVAVVPVKMNNTRLPNKNIKAFTNGEPLCRYIFNTLLKVDLINEVYVYCSEESIKDYLPEGVIYRTRSVFLDTDRASMTDVLKAFAGEVDAEIYLMTHTTAPFILAESIEAGLNAVVNGGYDSSFAAKKVQDFLWMDGRPFNYHLDCIPRTQDLPVMYQETSGFYIYNKSVIDKLGRRIGDTPYIVEVDEIEAIDIDEPGDFAIADAVYNYIVRRRC